MRQRVVGPGGPVLLPTKAPRRVCIVLLFGIGDLVHGLPLAMDLKGLDPAIQVIWVAEPAPAEVLAHHPGVEGVVVYRPRDGMRWLHTHVLGEGPWRHIQDLSFDLRWALGVPRDAPVAWGITLSREEEAERDTFFDALGEEPVAALVVASAEPRKDWLPERYARLADALERDLGFRVILLGGASPRERDAAATIMREASTRPVEALAGSVRTLLRCVSRAALVVAPDTGPLHVAHALGVPVVKTYGHTNPWRVGPWRSFRDLVIDRFTDPGDAPDPSAYLPRKGRMATTTVADVLEKAELARCRYL